MKHLLLQSIIPCMSQAFRSLLQQAEYLFREGNLFAGPCYYQMPLT
jgi:hypothetical protein